MSRPLPVVKTLENEDTREQYLIVSDLERYEHQRSIAITSVKECQFPVGITTNANGIVRYVFCNIAVVPGKPYCLEHCQLSYIKTTKKLKTENNPTE